MTNAQIAAFFDSLAETWDSAEAKPQQRIDKILDVADITQGKTVLDVACGTGVLIPDYIRRKVSKCVASDISPKMIEIAKRKFANISNVDFVCADAETHGFDELFDCAVIYNAFPHFFNRKMLFENIAKHLKHGGRLTVAHSMSRNALAKHHSGSAKNVSIPLPESTELAEFMATWFVVDTAIETNEIYIVSGLVI